MTTDQNEMVKKIGVIYSTYGCLYFVYLFTSEVSVALRVTSEFHLGDFVRVKVEKSLMDKFEKTGIRDKNMYVHNARQVTPCCEVLKLDNRNILMEVTAETNVLQRRPGKGRPESWQLRSKIGIIEDLYRKVDSSFYGEVDVFVKIIKKNNYSDRSILVVVKVLKYHEVSGQPNNDDERESDDEESEINYQSQLNTSETFPNSGDNDEQGTDVSSILSLSRSLSETTLNEPEDDNNQQPNSTPIEVLDLPTTPKQTLCEVQKSTLPHLTASICIRDWDDSRILKNVPIPINCEQLKTVIKSVCGKGLKEFSILRVELCGNENAILADDYVIDEDMFYKLKVNGYENKQLADFEIVPIYDYPPQMYSRKS